MMSLLFYLFEEAAFKEREKSCVERVGWEGVGQPNMSLSMVIVTEGSQREVGSGFGTALAGE